MLYRLLKGIQQVALVPTHSMPIKNRYRWEIHPNNWEPVFATDGSNTNWRGPVPLRGHKKNNPTGMYTVPIFI